MGLFGLGGGEVSGYNAAEVESLADVISSTAQKAGEGIVERLHNEIVVPMSSVWYAPEAQEFFQQFADTVGSAGENITAAFDAYRQAVQEAGKNWADNTKGTAPVLKAVQQVALNLSVGEILPDNAGNVTLDVGQAENIAGKLKDVEANIKSDLEKLAAQLNAETAFMGHNQSAALQECFVKVSGEIHRIFQFLTEGDESLQGQIKAAVEKYKQIAEGISSAFNNSGN